MIDHTPNSKVSRLEFVSTGTRRRWTLEEKERIVAESYGGPRLVSVTARRNGLSAKPIVHVAPVDARGSAERGCRASACSCGDRLYVGSGTEVRATTAIFGSCAASRGRNNRDRA
ncbi:transposase [Bradyrhizobium sp. USDA 4451]